MRSGGKWQLVALVPRTTYATFSKLKPEFGVISNSGFYYLLGINNRTYILNGQGMRTSQAVIHISPSEIWIPCSLLVMISRFIAISI